MKYEKAHETDRRDRFRVPFLLFLTSYFLLLTSTLLSAQLPSLFRGVVVADSSLGVRVVSIEESSQAAQADLRPEDIIVRVEDQEIRSIDAFATISSALKGRSQSTAVVVFRNGTPRELNLHLYSYPILRAWGIEFVPEHDVRFAQPATGRAHWSRMGRGFEDARNDPEALGAYLNALHNVPDDVPAAMKAVELSCRIGQRQFAQGQLQGGLSSLGRAVTMMQQLFNYPLDDAQLMRLRDQLRATLDALKRASSSLGPPLVIQTSV